MRHGLALVVFACLSPIFVLGFLLGVIWDFFVVGFKFSREVINHLAK